MSGNVQYTYTNSYSGLQKSETTCENIIFCFNDSSAQTDMFEQRSASGFNPCIFMQIVRDYIKKCNLDVHKNKQNKETNKYALTKSIFPVVHVKKKI